MSKIVGEENIFEVEKIMGSEDFSEYMLSVKGAVMLLGGGNREQDCIYPQHSNHFKIDENALPIGVASYVQTALDYLK